VLAYNVPGVTDLVLTRQQIVGIYNGSINNWNDTTFAEYNPGVDLSNATIVPVARFESSGSTEIFTRSLSSFSDRWAARYGVFDKRTGWDASVVTLFAQRNSGMADSIRQQSYRIGYVSTDSAEEVSLPFASIVNRQGHVTVADRKSVQAAMAACADNMTWKLTNNFVDCEGDETYPIAGYSYFIVDMTQEGNCSVAVELARYIDWFLTSPLAESEAANRLMVSVSSSIANTIRTTVLERMTCDGDLVMDLVRQQKRDEGHKWLPGQIILPFVGLFIILLIAYAIRQRVQYMRALNRDDWKINFVDIDFVVPKKRRWVPGNTGNVDTGTSSSSDNRPGHWNTNDVVARPLSIASVFDVNRKVKQALMRMREEIGHENVAKFFGIASHGDCVYLVEQHCANVTLVDFFRFNKYAVNRSFRYVVCADIANGMAYLHRHNVIHGNLSIDKCYVDSRWTIKIVDWEYTTLYDVVRRTDRNRTHSA